MKALIEKFKTAIESNGLCIRPEINPFIGRKLSIYFSGKTGKPIYHESKRRDGWDILNIISQSTGISTRDLCDKYHFYVFGNRITIFNH